MEILHFRENLLPSEPVIVTIGNFDGVHIGHQALIRTVVEESKERKCAGILVTFDPHPQEVIHPKETVPKICTPELRKRLLQETGLDAVHIIPFTPEFSQLTPEDFALHFLIEPFNLTKLVIGYDFHFGKKRAGNADLLRDLSVVHNYELEQISAVQIEEKSVNSTLIRKLIRENQFDKIPTFLGRPFSILGFVEKGDQRGRQLGFPTANVRPSCAIPLEKGVYVTKVQVNRQTFYGVTNVGIRPTFNNVGTLVETFIFDFSDTIYGDSLEVWPLKQLRKEKKFPNIDALKNQIQQDIQEAKQFLKTVE